MKVKRKSGGILLYRYHQKQLDFFLVHPGGPFWVNKDAGVWSIPKGEFDNDEDALTAAQREFEEETGSKLSGDFIALTPVVQKAGKQVYAWAVEGNIDPLTIQSNTFQIEWPPKSKQLKQFPEIDKGEWFSEKNAFEKIIPAQAAFIEEILKRVSLT